MNKEKCKKINLFEVMQNNKQYFKTKKNCYKMQKSIREKDNYCELWKYYQI